MAQHSWTKQLGASLGRIRHHILHAPKANYLSRISNPAQTDSLVSEAETSARTKQITRFQSLNPQDVDPITYSQFLAALHPISSGMGQLLRQGTAPVPVNHAELFNTYCLLPHPGVAYMRPEDFERFSAQMLRRRDFLKPNSLSPTSRFYLLSEQIILAFSRAQELRKRHLSMLWKIAQDMNVAEIPLAHNEQRQLIYMTLYKDRQDILAVVDEAFHQLNKSLLTYNEYEQMYKDAQETQYSRDSFLQFRAAFKDDLDIDTLNVFLMTALRHKDTESVTELMDELQNLEPNRETFQILLENLAYDHDIPQYFQTLQLLSTKYVNLVDSRLLNTLIKSLIELDMTEHAETLVNLFGADRFVPLETDELFLKQMTTADKQKYLSYWKTREQSSAKPPMAIYPTEDTFLPLLSAYCSSHNSVPFETILNLLFQCEQIWGIPITTRMFKHLFWSFTTSDHSIEDLRLITGKLVASHDVTYLDNDAWLESQLMNVDLPSNVMEVLNGAMEDKDMPVFQSDQGRFIKLTDELVQGIYQAFDHVLKNNPDLQKQAAAAHEQYKARLASARSETQPLILAPTLLELNQREEFMYIKKGFIIDLLDIAS